MVKIRCKLSYHSTKNSELTPFALGVRNGVYGNNPPFTTPPITQPDFDLLITNYSNKYAAYKAHTETKDEMEIAKGTLMDGLDTLSNYVNTVANGDANVIGIAGFVPTKGSASAVVIPSQPVGVKLERGISGVLLADCTPANNVICYGAILVPEYPISDNIVIDAAGQIAVNYTSPSPSPTPPEPDPVPSQNLMFILDLNKTRTKKFTGLVKGKLYYVYYYAINAAGVSPLSEGVALDPL